jgi:RNA polymerase sigma-70 factor (family 1)
LSTYSSYTDAQILHLLKHGDETAFTEIYQRYWKRLFGLAVYKLKDAAEAEEILQEIFLDLWRRRESLQIQTSLSSYLSVALSYRALNHFARLHRQRKQLSNTPADADYTLEHQLKARELNEDLQALVGELPEKCQLVFRLSREQDFTHRQIAEQLHISEKTVESHLTRALRLLRTGIGLCLSLFFLR